ncbi:Uridine 5'-monophosphate synthase, partial [Trichinella sp. T6]
LLKMDARYETFLTDLFHLGAIQFGEFMLKSKHTSPIYVDMRRLLSHPTLLNTVEDLMYDYAKELEYDVICGVPYGAIPLTSALSVKRSIPMIMQRKDAKAYGTKKIVEGLYKPGDKCLIIEDVITFGSSIAETARGASRNLENLGITKWSLFCLPDVLLLYEGRGLISNADCQRISSYLFNVTEKIAPSALGNGLQEGAKVDKLAKKIGKFICMLIIRSDLICKVPLVDFISELKTCAKSKNFMIMDDRIAFLQYDIFQKMTFLFTESMKTAEKDIDVIAGVVCSKPPVLDSRFLYMTSADESDQALLRFEDFYKMQFLDEEYLEMNHGIQYADIYKVWAFTLLNKLFNIGIFKFETVVMRSLYETPIFVDFQLAVSYPEIMNEIEELVHSCLLSNLKFHSICGVPEGGLPLASIISVKRNIPLLLYHKTKETTVTGKVIDGVWKKSDNCLIVDDVLMFGHSLADAADVLRQHELEVTDAIVLLDRCQGPENFLKSNDIRRHYLFNLTDVLSHLNEQALLTDFECLKISNHLLAFSDLAGKFVDQCTIDERMEPLFFSPDRLSMILHPKARKLWEIALSKHSNLCFACDLCSPREILRLVEAVAVNICSLKLHADLIVIKEMPDFFSRLKRLAQSKKFMLINDGNYCDDSDVVVELMLNSATKPASWADFVTVQCLNGSSVNSDYSVACLPVVEMSTSGNFFTEEYKKRALSLAQQYRQIVAGFICQKRPINDPSFLYISPGVHYKRRLDDQNWRTPDKAVRFNRDDIVVVGRGITKEKYSRVWAYTYQQISWDAFIIMNNAAANVE